jgi:hypothetical protein
MTNRAFAVKLACFFLTLGACQFAVHAFCPLSFPQKLEIDRARRGGVDIVFLGDSSVGLRTPDDSSDVGTTPEILQELLPGRSVTEVSHSGYRGRVYLWFSQYLAKRTRGPRTVIAPLNLRCFSRLADMAPRHQLELQGLILRHGAPWRAPFLRPLLVFKTFDLNPIADEEFLALEIHDGLERFGTLGDVLNRDHFRNPTEENARDFLVASYMAALREDDRNVQAVETMAEVLRAAGTDCLFYITPLDWQSGEKLLPGRFREQVEENARFLTARLEKRGARIVDLLFDLPTEAFSWPDEVYTVNEHLRDEGRRHVAARLAEALGGDDEG